MTPAPLPTIAQALQTLGYSERTLRYRLAAVAAKSGKPPEGWQQGGRLTQAAVDVLFGQAGIDFPVQSALQGLAPEAIGEPAPEPPIVGDLRALVEHQAATIDAMQEFCGDMARYVGDWMDAQERERQALRARLEVLERPPVGFWQRFGDWLVERRPQQRRQTVRPMICEGNVLRRGGAAR